jgi:hypothetical protein
MLKNECGLDVGYLILMWDVEKRMCDGCGASKTDVDKTWTNLG